MVSPVAAAITATAVVLTVLILPSFGYQLAAAPAPTPARLCSDCNSHCSSMCGAPFQLRECTSYCNPGPPPQCQQCRSSVLKQCTAGCNSGCCGGGNCDCAGVCSRACDSAGVCSRACDSAVENGCRNACTYTYDPYRGCGGCMAGAAQRCAADCYGECNANCVAG